MELVDQRPVPEVEQPKDHDLAAHVSVISRAVFLQAGQRPVRRETEPGPVQLGIDRDRSTGILGVGDLADQVQVEPAPTGVEIPDHESAANRHVPHLVIPAGEDVTSIVQANAPDVSEARRGWRLHDLPAVVRVAESHAIPGRGDDPIGARVEANRIAVAAPLHDPGGNVVAARSTTATFG